MSFNPFFLVQLRKRSTNVYDFFQRYSAFVDPILFFGALLLAKNNLLRGTVTPRAVDPFLKLLQFKSTSFVERKWPPYFLNLRFAEGLPKSRCYSLDEEHSRNELEFLFYIVCLKTTVKFGPKKNTCSEDCILFLKKCRYSAGPHFLILGYAKWSRGFLFRIR